jgi:hypothetical protein
VKQAGLARPTEPEIYLPYWQEPVSAMTLVVQAQGDPLQLMAPLRSLVQTLDKDQPIEHVQTMCNRSNADMSAPYRRMPYLFNEPDAPA